MNDRSPFAKSGAALTNASTPGPDASPPLTVFPRQIWLVITFLRVVFVLTFIGVMLGIPWMATAFIGIGIILGGLMAAGMFMVNSPVFGFVFSRGVDGHREVALTFDDGPDPLTTPRVLDILAGVGVVATFFVIGKRAVRHEAIVRRMAAEGHQVENHTWRHPVTQAVWPINRQDRIIGELERTNDLIESLCGVRPRFVRFPAGIKSIPLMRAVTRLGLIVAGFSVRAYDSRRISAIGIVTSITKKCFPGAIILLHDRARQAGESSSLVEALPDILAFLRENDYHCVRLDNLYHGFCLARAAAHSASTTMEGREGT